MAELEHPIHPNSSELSITHNVTNISRNVTDNRDSTTTTTALSIPTDAICRICRANHTDDKPLYHPCLCSGSIKYIHEECLSEWLQHSGQNKCEVCHFEYQYNLDWGSREKNAQMLNVVRKRDFIYYFIKKLLFSTMSSLRVLFVLILWFLVFVLNTLLISPFLPSPLMDKLFPKTNIEHRHNTFLTNRIFIDGELSFHSLFMSITFGGFAQIILFVALCVFEFHHRHRDGVVGDFGFAFGDEIPPVPPPQNNEPQPQPQPQPPPQQEDNAEDDDEEEEDEKQNDEGLGFNVLPPPDQDGGFLNPDNIRDARPIELLGLRGRFNAFFSTIISVTVFNVALISTLFWLPTVVGHCMILLRRSWYTVSMYGAGAMGFLYNHLSVLEVITPFVQHMLWSMVDALDALYWMLSRYLDIDVSMIQLLWSKAYHFILSQKPLISAYVASHPMICGYIVLGIAYVLGLGLDLAYYYFKRPYLVKERKRLKEVQSTQQIHAIWVFCEELSRIHTVFWRLIDSILRVCDFVFQLMVVPYIFGRGIAMSTQCIRLKKEHPMDPNPQSFLYLLDHLGSDDKLLHILESSLLQQLSYWMVGFWYIYASMKMFSAARHLMRIEFNACWMRFPEPNQIPISLSIARAMKERLISMRIHIPLILCGVHIPCKIMLKLFPTVFPINVYALEIHKWPTAGMVFMISCVLALILKRLRVQRRWNKFARYWLDTVCFALNIRYLVVPDAQPPEHILLETVDADAQRLLFEMDHDEHKHNSEEEEAQEEQKEEAKEEEGTWSASLLDDGAQEEEEEEEEKKEENQEIQRLFEKKEKLREENETLKAKIKRMKKEKKTNTKPVHRRDDVFLKPHPWQNNNDVYLRLQRERHKYMMRSRLYTLGMDHVRLRIFGFVMCLWITHVIVLCTLFLIPLVCGRLIFTQYFSSLSYIRNADAMSYIFGLFFCVMIPNELHFILSHHFQGTLLNNLRKFAIRVFVFLFIPLYLGYGWNSMIYHFLHSVSLTPIHCVLELFCTGIYIGIIALVFQNHNDLEDVLVWIQNNNHVNLYRFWTEFACPCLKFLIYHISLPIAVRYWMWHYINGHQNSMLRDDNRSTVIIDLNSIDAQAAQDIDLLQRSVLKLQSILMNGVHLHYNSYELYLFLSCEVWNNLYQFIFVEYNWNIVTFLYQPFMVNPVNNLIISNAYVMCRFAKFVTQLLLLRCPIPLFGAIEFTMYLINAFINHIPKIKNIILQERYDANRRLINFQHNNQSDQEPQPVPPLT